MEAASVPTALKMNVVASLVEILNFRKSVAVLSPATALALLHPAEKLTIDAVKNAVG